MPISTLITLISSLAARKALALEPVLNPISKMSLICGLSRRYLMKKSLCSKLLPPSVF